jgi:TolB protein
LRSEGGKLVLEGRLIDLKSGQAILGKRYRSEASLARRMAHTFADEIVLYFTGRRGVALTAIAFTSDRDAAKEIYLMDADGQGSGASPATARSRMSPAWRPRRHAGLRPSSTARPASTSSSWRADKSAAGHRGQSQHLAQLRPTASRPSRARWAATLRSSPPPRRLEPAPPDHLRRASTPSRRGARAAARSLTSSRAGNPHISSWTPRARNVRRVTSRGRIQRRRQLAAGRHADRLRQPARQRLRHLGHRPGDLREPADHFRSGQQGVASSRPTAGDRVRLARGGSTQIYVMGADGTEPRRLTSQGNNSGPEWSAYPK